ncbi:MAG: hypothetical protein V4729_10220, partial [Pseudomonadota bacterium]
FVEAGFVEAGFVEAGFVEAGFVEVGFVGIGCVGIGCVEMVFVGALKDFRFAGPGRTRRVALHAPGAGPSGILQNSCRNWMP